MFIPGWFVVFLLVRLEAGLGRDYKFQGGPVGGLLMQPETFAECAELPGPLELVRLPFLGATKNARGAVVVCLVGASVIRGETTCLSVVDWLVRRPFSGATTNADGPKGRGEGRLIRDN